MSREVKQVGVIGAGTMGRGIAQIAATAGCSVVLMDTNRQILEDAAASYKKIFHRLVEKERVTEEEAEQILERIVYKTALADLAEADLLIEAIVEDLMIKQQVFKELETLVAPDVVIASNTSSLSITALAAGLSNQERFLGLHFFNPAPLLHLVEVVPGVNTNASVVDAMKTLMSTWGKVPAIAKDTPGFIVNRIARPFYGESLRMLEEGIATPYQIDHALKTQGGFRMGPFELMDLIGNDINLKVTQTVFQAFHYDPRFMPSFLQQRMVEAGRLGRKSGIGYFKYDDADIEEHEQVLSEKQAEAVFLRVLVLLINEALDALYRGIGRVEDIENAMEKGVNYPKGLLAWADELGPAFVLQCLNALYDKYKEQRYRPHPLLLERVEQGRALRENIECVTTGLEELVAARS